MHVITLHAGSSGIAWVAVCVCVCGGGGGGGGGGGAVPHETVYGGQ